MAGNRLFVLWAACLLHLVAGNALVGKKLNTCTSGGTISSIAHCIHHGGTSYLSGYCSSVLSITTPTSLTESSITATTYEDTTVTTGTTTVTAQPITEFSTRTNTVNATTTFTDVSTEYTATITSFNVTKTTTSTSTQLIYTCGGGSSSVLISSSSALISSSSVALNTSSNVPMGTGSSSPLYHTSSASSAHGNLSISATPTGWGTGVASSTLVPYPALLAKRAFTTPPCLRHEKEEYGNAGIRSACTCFGLPTPAAVTSTVTVVDPSTTVTSTLTVEVEATTSVTTTSTETSFKTTTAQFSTTVAFTTSIASTAFGTFTLTQVVTSVVTTSSPTPTSFNVFYVDSADNSTSPSNRFFRAVNAPGGSGIVITDDGNADNFGLDSQMRLLDLTVGDFLAKNTYDVYPIEILVTGAQTANTPICSACNGILQCDYPGTFGSTFALCYGYLALGNPKVFGKDSDGDGEIDCVAIALQYK